MATVQLRDIVKTHDGVEAVRRLDLDIADREFVVILGPSGCGKTTVLRMIAGLESITGGHILFDGQMVDHLPPRARNIAMVFQNYALYAHMTCFDNIAFNLRLRRVPAPDIKERVQGVAGLLNLGKLLGRQPFALSGGQRQRVAMGRALVRNPDVFLFDEPLSNLDAKLRVQMRTEIRAIHQRLHTTTIYVTHDQIEALALADRVVVMQEGRIAQIGTPLEVYDYPANRFVAGFLGSPSMNFIEGRMQAHGGHAYVVAAEGGVRLKLPEGADFVENRPIVYGIRPEDVAIDGAADDASIVVEVVEPTGTGIQVFGRLADAEFCVVLNGRPPVKSGDRLAIRPDLNRVRLFDAQDGRAQASGMS